MIKEFSKMYMIDKIDRLLEHFGNSSRLAEELKVSRNTVVSWKDNPDAMRDGNKVHVNVLYCDTFVTPELDKMPLPNAILLPDDYRLEVALPFIKSLSWGTFEIEDMSADRTAFDRVADGKLPRGVTAEQVHGMANLWFTTTDLWRRIVDKGERFTFDATFIRGLHRDLMRNVRPDAGDWATKFRGMRNLEDVRTTDPEDIEPEVSYWCSKHADAQDLRDLAQAHAHFILMHPFGDGNGRVGRTLMTIQALQARLLPPALGRDTQALYYSTMAYAMRHGRHTPLQHVLQHAQELALKTGPKRR